MAVGLIGACIAQADTVRSVAEQAQQRAGTYAPAAAPSVSEGDRAHAEELAKQALARGREALADWQASQQEKGVQPAATGKLPGHSKEVDGPPHDEDVSPEVEGRLIVALSSSMPLTMIHDYMRQLAGVPGAVVVLRGFVGGAQTVAPTGKWIEEARRVDLTCQRCEHYNVEVVVDPLIYRALKIEEVPAVAYAAGVKDLSHCDGKTLPVKSIAYGATSVEAAVRSLVAEGVAVPNGVLEKVRKRGWEYKSPKSSGSP